MKRTAKVKAPSYFGHLEAARLLVTRGADKEQQSNSGMRPLHAATDQNQPHMVEYFLSLKVAIDEIDNSGQTALLQSSYRGDYRTVELLLNNGAQADIGNNQGFQPIHMAAQQGHLNILKTLIKKGQSNMLSATKTGVNALFLAAKNGHLTIIDYLISKGFDVNVRTTDGCTPLYAASFYGHVKSIEKLLNSGADVKLSNDDQAGPLHVAAQEGHREAVEVLVRKGRADIYAMTASK